MTSSRARWRVVRIVIGIVLAAAALWVCVRRVDPQQLWAAFGQAKTSWVIAGVGSVFVTLGLVTVRWRLLLGDAHPAAPRGAIGDTATATTETLRWRGLWDAVVVGQAVNIIFPLRFGEGARVAVTCGELGYPVGRVMLGVAVERALDMTAFATAVLLLLAAGGMPGRFRSLVPTVAILIGATVAIILCVVWFLPAGVRWLRHHARVPSRMVDWLETQEASIHSGWIDVTRGPQLVVVVAVTAVTLVSSASTNFLIFRAFDLPVPPIAALVVLAVLQVGTAVVSVPGNIGVFHYLTVVALAAWQVPQPIALAAAVVLHIVSLGPRVVLGGIAAAGMRLRRAHVSPPESSGS